MEFIKYLPLILEEGWTREARRGKSIIIVRRSLFANIDTLIHPMFKEMAWGVLDANHPTLSLNHK